jgi:hypothetical protein
LQPVLRQDIECVPNVHFHSRRDAILVAQSDREVVHSPRPGIEHPIVLVSCELRVHVDTFVAARNATTTPFAWTKAASKAPNHQL